MLTPKNTVLSSRIFCHCSFGCETEVKKTEDRLRPAGPMDSSSAELIVYTMPAPIRGDSCASASGDIERGLTM